ncbi:tRNA (uracil-5-)-methyltransferase [Wickerhamomyces ciferrii]|uniref:tRNA (Uracil-5-)-methyltransferase n=1 Tax=Wickerhamomyces ciferrii (strain ATCC 14091 / BCRC 22168 / CBS 111 / JCM 3599 / NBRC 0793 / NRRL Y-1031 F-60-10) TaxID=1206466 RepID=K0KHL3_WICCF|nr:tRNA (uracil-5-)-methyltransferase [Wickerhamomyces ciferrii]CCH44700.1 tRNA (uracil-5-)-methyltransferase [Wickerhamomyces ciferrii]
MGMMVEPSKRELSPVGSPNGSAATTTEPLAKKQNVEKPNTNNSEETQQQSEQPKKQFKKFEKQKKKRKYKQKEIDQTAPLGILQFEIKQILEANNLGEDEILNDINRLLNEPELAPTYHRDVQNVPVLKLSSNGDGLALIPHPVNEKHKQIVIIPFAIPGDIVDLRVFKTHPNYVESDLLKIVTPSFERDNSLIKCKYFGKCSGCQYQELPYQTQLEYKRRTVRNAYEHLAQELVAQGKVPEIGETVGSPLMFGYRTKLTPHFDVPRKGSLAERPPIGFGKKGKPEWRQAEGGDKSVLDIEECIIGTKIINIGMKNERAKFDKEWNNYKKGATVLLREHTRVAPNEEVANKTEFQNEHDGSRDPETNEVSVDISVNEDEALVKSCVTKPRQIVTEYINGFTFEFSAGEFFQNNNSILPKVTEFVCSNLQIPRPEGTPLYLVDAYCGSGLFSITASKGVDRVVGVDVSADSVKFAQKNAERNGVKNAEFIDGKAEKIFAKIDTPSDLTSVIIDPSRKGCDEVFLNQLSDYKPARVVYVSCNVHSQARDIQWFLNNTKNGPEYKIESVRGFDFFPQTHHVESVAVLTRVN